MNNDLIITSGKYTFIGENDKAFDRLKNQWQYLSAEFDNGTRMNGILHVIITKGCGLDQKSQKFADVELLRDLVDRIETSPSEIGKIEYECVRCSCEPREINMLIAFYSSWFRPKERIGNVIKEKLGLGDEYSISIDFINSNNHLYLVNSYIACVEGRYERYEIFPSFWNQVECVEGW